LQQAPEVTCCAGKDRTTSMRPASSSAQSARPFNQEFPLEVIMADPWSRPTLSDLREVLESIGRSEVNHHRSAERLELSVPAEITTSRGNTISAVTREISRFGIGLLHKGFVNPEEVTVRMASDTREFEYRVALQWCSPCDNGMFISGGRFVSQNNAK